MALHSKYTPEHSEQRGLSLCAGYAGIDLGLHIAEPKYQTVCYVEREAHAAATLVARMADKALAEAPIWDDLKSFDGRPWCGKVHILTAGYPCQPFSYAGQRKGQTDRRHLWPDIERIIDEVQPEWVFCENVSGHVTLGLPNVVKSLHRLGYRCKAGLFTAAETGASHLRQRVFILAHANRCRRRLYARPNYQTWNISNEAAARLASDQLRTVQPAKCSEIVDVSIPDDESSWVRDFRGQDGIYPPDPDQLEDWNRQLTIDPDLYPAILRTNDGMAERLDRRRAAGNGVCSMAAAVAWAVLKADFQRDTF